jgi:adenosylcobyric acid synthase
MVGKPIYVVPFVYDMNLPEEDGLGVERRLVNELSETTGTTSQQKPVVVIIAYPHISITSDFTPLENDDAYEVVWRRNGPPPRPYPETAAVILPGSRLTRLDLEWLRSRPDWVDFLHTHVERGGVLLGLCGGYQMLGMNVSDPDGIEGDSGTSIGLGFLPVETIIAPVASKIVTPRVGYLPLPTHIEEQDNQPPDSDDRVAVQGFELRCGRTVKISHDNPDDDTFGKFDADVAPLLQLMTKEPGNHDTDHDGSDAEEENEGMRKGNVYGTYLHGILASRRARHALLSGIHRYHLEEEVGVDNDQDPLDKFAKHLESCGLDYDTVWSMIHDTN